MEKQQQKKNVKSDFLSKLTVGQVKQHCIELCTSLSQINNNFQTSSSQRQSSFESSNIKSIRQRHANSEYNSNSSKHKNETKIQSPIPSPLNRVPLFKYQEPKTGKSAKTPVASLQTQNTTFSQSQQQVASDSNKIEQMQNQIRELNLKVQLIEQHYQSQEKTHQERLKQIETTFLKKCLDLDSKILRLEAQQQLTQSSKIMFNALSLKNTQNPSLRESLEEDTADLLKQINNEDIQILNTVEEEGRSVVSLPNTPSRRHRLSDSISKIKEQEEPCMDLNALIKVQNKSQDSFSLAPSLMNQFNQANHANYSKINSKSEVNLQQLNEIYQQLMEQSYMNEQSLLSDKTINQDERLHTITEYDENQPSLMTVGGAQHLQQCKDQSHIKNSSKLQQQSSEQLIKQNLKDNYENIFDYSCKQSLYDKQEEFVKELRFTIPLEEVDDEQIYTMEHIFENSRSNEMPIEIQLKQSDHGSKAKTKQKK